MPQTLSDGYFSERYVAAPHRDNLTRRQLDVLRCYSVGMTERMAADVLGVSVQTVKDHLWHARNRLAAKNTPHAVAIALRLHLID